MNRIIFILTLSAFLFSQQAEVTNIQAAQRTDGSKLVDITYDITEDILFTSFNVSVEVSFDGGATYTQTIYVDGDVGVNIISGTGRQITWFLGNEYPDIFFDDVKVKVIANGYIAGELPFEFVTVPAGGYIYGPGDTVLTIDYDYEIMKYEVTNAQYVEFLIEANESGELWISNSEVHGFYPGDEHYDGGYYKLYALGESSEDYNYGQINWNGTAFIVTEGYGDHPAVYTTWFGAYKFAEQYELRLPTEQEWEKAARGNTGYDYPWGNSIDGSRANYTNSGDPWDNGTTPAGFFNGQNYEGFQTTDSPSPYGAYDMAGNVWEWTDNWYNENSSNRVQRGGSWFYGSNHCPSWLRYSDYAYYSLNHVGFRLVRTISE